MRFAGIQTSSGFMGPGFKLRTSGNHTVVYRWHIDWLIKASVASGPHSGAVVLANITLFGNVYDTTTSTWVFGQDIAHVVYNLTLHPSFGRFNYSGSQNVTLTLRMSLTGGDQYLFFTGLFTSVSVRAVSGCYSLCGDAWAFAVVNVGSNGHRASVLSMKVV
ncbi:MAG: hypothetical protein L3J97_00060 [Thermoplasmata archaeon]|nr:hypothetical protein [Thermoplasmata archaeon]